ncbi:MAG TPA: hypothetical protein VIA62_06880 [Thermoanaerobaculia bacterium]|jgi:hypothetical protein|nr:hypothetical protein [Thermoanaerobaculia bacterium]
MTMVQEKQEFDRWPEGTWILELRGEESELRYVCDLLGLSPLRVVEVQGRFYLDAPELRNCTEEQDVFAVASRSLETLLGFLALQDLAFEITQGCLARTVTGKPPTQYIRPSSVVSTARVGIPTVIGGIPVRPTPRQLQASKWLVLAEGRSRVKMALRILSRADLDWYDLHKLVELVQLESGSPAKHGWIASYDLKRLTQTANSADAAGDQARHAPRFEAPKKPMQILDAQKLVVELVQKWLESLSTNYL